MSIKEDNNSKKIQREDKRDNVHILSDEEQEKQLEILGEQILKHKDMFIRLRDK